MLAPPLAAGAEGEDEESAGAVLAVAWPSTPTPPHPTPHNPQPIHSPCSAEGEDEEGAGAVLAVALRPPSGLDGGEDTSSTDEEVAAAPAAGAAGAARRHMGAPLRREVAALLLRLASKAQFAKVRGRASVRVCGCVSV